MTSLFIQSAKLQIFGQITYIKFSIYDFKVMRVLKVFEVLRDFGRFALITTVFLAERCHALGETAIINKIRFKPLQLSVQ